MLIILIGSNYIQAQKVTDTICISTPQFRKIYAAALQKRAVDSLLKISDGQISELQFQINILQQKDTATVSGYNKQIKDLQGQVSNYVLEKQEYERVIKWDKFKRTFWGGVSAVIIGFLGYLYITK